MLLQDGKDSQKKDKGYSIAWQTYAVEKLVDLESEIQDMVQHNDKLPDQLLEVANAILKTSSGLNSLKNHKKDFERLLGEASPLVVILWQSYIETELKYPSLDWPPPKLRDLLNELVDTTCCIHKLMERKSEKNLAKRVLLGCFGIRDLGKFNQYQRKLRIMALYLQSKPHNIDIYAVLLAVVHSRAQPQDELEDDLPDKQGAKKKAADKKATAEGSRLREVGKSTTVKLADERVRSDEVGQRKSSNVMIKAKDKCKHERDEERSTEDKPDRRRIDTRTNCDKEVQEKQDRSKTMRCHAGKADLVECTSAQGSRKKAADKKPMAEGSRLREVGKSTTVKLANERVKSEEDSLRKSSKANNEPKDNRKHELRRRIDTRSKEAQENQDGCKTMRYQPGKADVVEHPSAQGSRPNNAEGEANIKNMAPKRSRMSPQTPGPKRSRTNPVSPQISPQTSHFSVINGSEGTMVNKDMGNTYNRNEDDGWYSSKSRL